MLRTWPHQGSGREQLRVRTPGCARPATPATAASAAAGAAGAAALLATPTCKGGGTPRALHCGAAPTALTAPTAPTALCHSHHTAGPLPRRPKALARIHSYLRQREVPLAAVQVQFSLLSYGSLQAQTKAVADDLGACHTAPALLTALRPDLWLCMPPPAGITLIAYSPLALGLLSGPAPAHPGPECSM